MKRSVQPVCASFILFFTCFTATISADSKQPPRDPFQQLDDLWPTPTERRLASGAPGSDYWQQRADYDIDVEIDDAKQELRGRETVTYFNRSPDTLDYLWVQLDQNRYEEHSHGRLIAEAPDFTDMAYETLAGILHEETFKGGHRILSVTGEDGSPLAHTRVKTMLRIDLDEPLKPGDSFTFEIRWFYPIGDAKVLRRRSGFEYFEEDKNYLYQIAQWYPRMAAYTDVRGWQNKQTIGAEFALEFGNYRVRITVPNDHIVASTGVLQNESEVLTESQQERLERARESDRPVLIVTPEEAKKNESTPATGTKTWVFEAENVRDFAFATSRKFIWDAMTCVVDERPVLAMSYWPKEGDPLWTQYSTHAVAHTLEVYSRLTVPYPYPVAISVNGPVPGMEYPMITFQSPRPEKDGTYSKGTKYGLISVIIHEIGHNWFPMIINTDERQWRWMDEGLNSFLQLLAELEWEPDYPSRRFESIGALKKYLQRTDIVPVMTAADGLRHGGYNAYAKPTLALSILRETILGRDLFDFAFKQYARRWQFKRPEPADFFRTIEDAAGVDLDWFWRGWFYSTLHPDISIERLRLFELDTRDPDIEKPKDRAREDENPVPLARQREANRPKKTESLPELRDFYNEYDPFEVTKTDREEFKKLIGKLDEDQQRLLKTQGHFYVIDFDNKGGLVMPIILELHYTDDSSEIIRIPAEIWQRNPVSVSKMLYTSKTIERIVLDPLDDIADVNSENNHWPRRVERETFRLNESKEKKNPMQIRRDETKPDRKQEDSETETQKP